MTAQFSQTGIILPSNLTADITSSKTNINYDAADDNAFASALDNASKSYADKNTNKVENVKDNKDYAGNTKDLNKSNDKNEIRDDKNTDKYSDKKTDNRNSSKTDDKNNVKESSEDNKNVDNKKDENKVSDKESCEKSDKTEKTESTEESEATPEKSEIKELGEAALKEVEKLLNDIQNNAAAVVEKSTETKAETELTRDNSTVKNITDKVSDNTKTIANEQILANVEYSQETPEINLEKIKNMTPQELKALVENIQKNTANSTAQTAESAATEVKTEGKTLQAVSVENLSQEVSADDLQMQNETKTETKTDNSKLADNTKVNQEQSTLKTAKESLAADTSRLTANIEQTQETANVKAVTPTDTEADKTPVIKVTEEVASQVKENTFNGIENKDNTSKIKDKAVQTMTALQDTDTTVTESKTTNSGTDSNSGNNSNNAMNQGKANAAETAAKLSVDQGAVNFNQSNGAEVFVNKLDAQLSAMQNASNQAKTLNQTDIMSQVTAKFEQLQQQGSNKVSIVLQPENLGRVSVEIMSSKDGLVAKMTTDTQQVKELFDKNVEALKSNLSSQGVNVNSIKVECSQESSNHGMEFEREQFNQSFQNQQNGQNQTNHSNQNTQSVYGTEYNSSQTEDVETENGTEIKNTETIIRHNGKVDYKV